MASVRHGLESVIPFSSQLLSLLTAEEIELRVCGQVSASEPD